MKYFLSAIFLFLMSLSMPALAAWQKTFDMGILTTYKSPSDSHLALTKSNDLPNGLSFNEELVEKLKTDKQQMLKKMGITNWSSPKIDVKKNKDSTNIVLQGDYINPADEKVFYLEKHLYRPPLKIQILISNTNKANFLKDISSNELKAFEIQNGF